MRTRKKGFTLIEMLVVIAIIAILVAVIIPVVGSSTTRAAAATNAANLRAVEAQLNIMRLDYDDIFTTKLDEEGDSANAFQSAYTSIYDLWYGQGASAANDFNKYATFTANADGTVNLWQPIVVENVPAAAQVKLVGSNYSNSVVVAAGSPMTIVIANGGAHAYYGTQATGYYSVDTFADIAEDGKLDGVVTGGNVGGDGLGGLLCDFIGHNYVNGVCTRCGMDANWHDHVDEKGTVLWIFPTDTPDGKCDVCGQEMP